MNVNRLAGGCLILFGVINVLHEITVRSSGRSTPGFGYAFVTALFFTLGAVFFFRRSAREIGKTEKAKGPSILSD